MAQAQKQLGLLLAALLVEGVMLSMLWDVDLWLCGLCSLLVVAVLHSTTSVTRNLLWRARLMSRGALHFVLSSEKKGLSKMPDPALLAQCDRSKVRTKTVIFIRHGESDWNEMFNKGFWPIGFLRRVLRGVTRELILCATQDSVFYDSPLSPEGVDQASELQKWLRTEAQAGGVGHEVERLAAILNGGPAKMQSVICSSNLRRALATTTIGLWGRLQRTREQVWVLSELQEMSRNVDTLALAKAKATPRLPVLERELGQQFASGKAERWFNNTYNHGNKGVKRRGADSLLAFAKWTFERNEETVIVGGHSLWFRTFFRQFLPRDRPNLDAKKKKMVNAGVVAFQLSVGVTTDGTEVFHIDPATVKVVYGGFK